MDLLRKMNDTVTYIEDHLADTISYEKLAQIACCSTYHLQRMFPFITGVALSEYIRRRRLTLAAFELQSTNVKVIDVALKYGYDSPEAFTRAFKLQHGITPLAVRDNGHTLKAYPRLSFHISIRGDEAMNYRIEEKAGFEMFGVYAEVSSDQQQAFIDVPRFRKQCDDDETVDEMNEILGRFPNTMLHAALFNHKPETFKYMISYYKPKGIALADKFTTLSVPTLTWAIFPTSNVDDMQKLWVRIYSEWFATSEYEQIEGPTFEMYYGMSNNNIGEIWIPVKKRD